MNAGVYGGVAWLELERQRKERALPKAERDSKVCDDCPLFEKTSARVKCCGDQQPDKGLHK